MLESKIVASSGIFSFLSMTTLIGELPIQSRVVKIGLSFITVLVPTKIACSCDLHDELTA